MASNQDIALYRNDLYAADGDFAVIESDVQHVSDTLAAIPGWWKENPPDGVGVMLYLRSSGQQQALRRNIKIQLQSDGYRSDQVQVSLDVNGQLTIIPNAEKL